jgi:hypothetical protein
LPVSGLYMIAATEGIVMADNTERQFQEADAAVDRAVAAFVIKIERMSGKWQAVAPAYNR